MLSCLPVSPPCLVTNTSDITEFNNIIPLDSVKSPFHADGGEYGVEV